MVVVKDPKGKVVSCHVFPGESARREIDDCFLGAIDSMGRNLSEYDWMEISETNHFENEKGSVDFIPSK
jgi:hypothetical protein